MAAFAIAAALPLLAVAADAPPSSPRLLAAGCAGCHGTDGRAQAGAKALAGIDKGFFIGQMRAFRSGQQPATVMHQIAKGYGDAEIETLASYFASQRR